MSYEQISVYDVVSKITQNEYYLPAIQRKLVWKYEQMESLFDSLMKGYPIGTFLFWYVSGDNKNNYTFYKFIQEYHERDRNRNEIAPRPELRETIVGVLDGQQRLGSLFIALQGSYAYKLPGARWANDASFPKRKCYLNILHVKSEMDLDEEFEYEFKFLTEGESHRSDETHLWFQIRGCLAWGKDPQIDEYYDDLLENITLSEAVRQSLKKHRNNIKSTLRILHQRLVIEKLISYFKVEEQALDDVLVIFERVNSGGTVLSKSDLLFSTIVASWEEARSEIEELLDAIRKKGDGFYFNNDFIMRACLVLTDAPVLFKVRSFRKENIVKIRKEWENIRSAIENTVNMLVEFGFSGENLTSQNAVIPIAYYLLKGGSTDANSKKEIRKYLITALFKQTFSGQGDQVLNVIRAALRKEVKKSESTTEYVLRDSSFILNSLSAAANLPSGKTLKIVDSDIDGILDQEKGPGTFMALSLLYPNLKFSQVKFHQDHVHPFSLFSDSKLKSYGVPESKWDDWQKIRSQLPNLQLMEGAENISKNRTPFKDWLLTNDSEGKPNVPDKEKYMRDNYIPGDTSLELTNFEDFFKKRRNILEAEIRGVLP